MNNVFYGLRPASAAMVAEAGLSVVGLALLYSGQAGLAAVNWKAVALAAVLLVADPLVQAHQGPAPHRVHSGLRHHRRGVLLLKNEYKSQYSHRRLRYVVTFCVKIAPPAERTGETMKKRVSRRLCRRDTLFRRNSRKDIIPLQLRLSHPYTAELAASLAQ